ncbi:MAG: hypothetical protein P8J50_03465 [Acidimicrobiales bacterium]|jgi:hypothetical protein|nr:hypothetical protein [Acidimicrobiales bacterium]
MTRVLTLDEKRALYRDGYVVAKAAVAPRIVDAALDRIARAEKGEYLGYEPEMTDLINQSELTPILRDAIGDFDPPSACQMGLIKRSEPDETFNAFGYRTCDMPYYNAQIHIDGMLTMFDGPQVHEIQQGTPEEIYARYMTRGPKGDLGRSADVIGGNFTPLFQDPEMTLALGSFTSFVFVALSDQTMEGYGQTNVFPGGHHAMQTFLREQRSINNHLGPEGPGWARLDHDAPNRCGLVYVPPTVQAQFIDDTSDTTPDGRRWPRPTPIFMEPGDALIATYQIPHSGSMNVNGTESRKTMVFRIRNKKRQPDVVVTGMSDHPDRGWLGEWLDFEPGNDPWERSKHAMCNIWDEWEGLQDVVTEAATE